MERQAIRAAPSSVSMAPTISWTVGSSRRRAAWRSAASRAASAAPRYTEKMAGSAVAATMCHTCDQRPDGRRTVIAASGTKTASSVTSWEPVPRMPRVRQLSCRVTPGASSGMTNCTTVGPSAGSS